MAKDDRVVFEQTVESMFVRALKDRMTPRLKKRLLKLGIDVDHKLRATYTREVWIAALRTVVEELYPSEPEERAFFQLGERLVDCFPETMVGAALFSVLKVIGPKQSLRRLPQTLRYANNYNDAKVIELGPGEFDLQVNETEVSSQFMAGSIAAILRVAGAEDPKVRVIGCDGCESRLHVQL